jgi:hypothetical protein
MNVDNASFDQKNFSAKFSNKEYYFEFCLLNSIGNIVYLKKGQLLSLVIEDNIFNPFHIGNMIINDDNNLLEKGPNPYTFLGNGRDILILKIVPTPNNKFEPETKDEKIKEFLGFDFKFVIVESKQILYNNAVCRRLDFIEYGHYALAENICNIFGITQATGIGNYMNTNAGNSMPTGEVVKKILEEVFKSADIYYKDPQSGETIFDMSGNEPVMVSPYGLVSYMEVLTYVLGFHIHEESPCILSFDRHQKKFIMMSLKRLFEKHDNYVQESIYLPNQTKSNSPDSVIKWPYSKYTFAESRVNKIFIESPAAKYNINYSSNGAIMSHCKSTKSMIFDMQSLHSDTFTEKYYNLFVKPFENTFNSYKLDVNFHISPNIQDNYNTYKGNLPPILEEKKYLNQKLSTLLYLNGSVYQFKLEGLTHRQAMTFIDVVKYSDNPEDPTPTKWDLQNVGRHLVTSVKHIFTQDTYTNEIETIKPYIIKDESDDVQSIKDLLNKPKSSSNDSVDTKLKETVKNTENNVNKTKNLAAEVAKFADIGKKIEDDLAVSAKNPNLADNQKRKLEQHKSDLKKMFGNPNMSDEEFEKKVDEFKNNVVLRTYPFKAVINP